MGKVIRYCKTEEEFDGENVFDISRPNIFGNPYTHIKKKKTKALVVVKDREKAIKLYDVYFDKMLETDENFRAEWNSMFDAYIKYGVIYLGCYCKLNESCHADIITKKLKQRAMKIILEKAKTEKEERKESEDNIPTV